VLAEAPEGGGAVEAGALQSRVRLPAQEAHRRLEAEAMVHARDRAQRLAHDEGDLLRRRVLLQRFADVAVPASIERLRLVSEVSKDGVVTAASAFRPPHELQEEPPLVGEHGFAERVALEEVPSPRHVAWRDEHQAPGGGAVAAG